MTKSVFYQVISEKEYTIFQLLISGSLAVMTRHALSSGEYFFPEINLLGDFRKRIYQDRIPPLRGIRGGF